jgi:cytochrome c-type biogenesis protein CcmH
MLLWMILTSLCSAAAVLVATPFLRRYGEREDAASADLLVYRDQLGEVEREVAAGMIAPTQAEGARVEIGRRLIAAQKAIGAAVKGPTLAGNQVAIVGVTGIVVLGSVIIYALSGRPDLPSAQAVRPHGVATTAAGPPTSAGAGQTAPRSPDPSAAQAPQIAAGTAPGLGSVDEMIERIAARLEKNPGNAEDWRMLGWSYFGTDRYGEAADAYGKAAQLQPKNAQLFASQGEALVRASQGQITPQAMAVLETTHKLDPKEPRARFFLGMAKEQAGNKAAALADWVALAKEADPAEPWVADLLQRIAELAGQMGIAVPDVARAAAQQSGPPGLALLKDAEPAATATVPARPVTPSAKTTEPRGPTAEDVKAAEALSAGDRNTMIRGMVDGLAARLEKNPRDADGWIKLIRSRKVLGEEADASQALKKALEIFADAPAERAQIVAAAMELQVKP